MFQSVEMTCKKKKQKTLANRVALATDAAKNAIATDGIPYDES